MQRGRSRLFDVALVLWTALFAPAAVALSPCGAPERAVRRTARAWARGTLRLRRHQAPAVYARDAVNPSHASRAKAAHATQLSHNGIVRVPHVVSTAIDQPRAAR